MNTSHWSKRELREAVIERARRDLPFRKALLERPRGAIYEHFGIQIPETFKIRFIERDPELDALVVLPPLDEGTAEHEELGDGELDMVAGGVQTEERPDSWADGSDLW